MVESDDFSVHDAIRQLAGGPRYRAEFGRPIEALAGLQGDLTALNPHLDAVAVEFDLVDPIAAGRRALHRSTQLRRDERGHVCDRTASSFSWRPSSWRERLVRAATGAGPLFAEDARAAARWDFHSAFAGARDLLRRDERLRSPTFTRRDLVHRSAGGHRRIFVQNLVFLSFPGELIAMLDQEPVGALFAFSLAHPGQNPAAMKLFTLQGEVQLAFSDTRAPDPRSPNSRDPKP